MAYLLIDFCPLFLIESVNDNFWRYFSGDGMDDNFIWFHEMVDVNQ